MVNLLLLGKGRLRLQNKAEASQLVESQILTFEGLLRRAVPFSSHFRRYASLIKNPLSLRSSCMSRDGSQALNERRHYLQMHHVVE